MTMVVAIKYKEGIVLASDTRTVSGLPLKKEKGIKIIDLNGRIGLATAGIEGIIDKFVHFLKHSLIKNKGIDDVLNIAEDVAANLDERYGERVNIDEDSQMFTAVLADSEKIYRVFDMGFSEPEEEYCCEGSSRLYGEYILGGLFRKNMDVELVKELAVYVILQSSKFDQNVGEVVQLATIDKNGLKMINPKVVDKIIDTLNGREKVINDAWISMHNRSIKKKIKDILKK